MAFGLFSKKPKTYVERNPSALSIYNALSPQERKVLDEISFLEQGHGSADEKLALQRIVDVFLAPSSVGSSASQLKTRAKQLYATALTWLNNSELTTNVNASLFMNEAFLSADGMKTMWNTQAGKGNDYNNKRQAVEESAFGYTIDWSVPLKRAADLRPLYAGLNFSRHPYGAAAAYGSIVLVYKPSVMHRCTFISTDTFSEHFGFDSGDAAKIAASRAKICTPAQFSTLLATISDKQLRSLLQSCSGQFVVDDYPPNYIEAHVHGGVKFAQDLAAIRISTSGQTTFEKEVGFFETKNKRPGARGAVEYVIGTFAEKYGVSARYYNKNRVVGVIA